MITDGVVYDQDYELNYAAADARRAVEEARSAGTACIAVSVGGGASVDDLAEVFGAANILTVDEVPQITRRIREVSRHALATVSQRRFTGSRRPQRPR